MSWDNAVNLEQELSKALETFNWSLVDSIINQLIEMIKKESSLFPDGIAKKLLAKLRRKRRFCSMVLLAEALIQSGHKSSQIRRQYAQALIDQGMMTAPQLVLQSIIQNFGGEKGEEMEAHGLMGRIYKQIYVNNNDSSSPRNRENLTRAFSEYFYAYNIAQKDNLWHGINAVALLDRAKRDGLSLFSTTDSDKIANNILDVIVEKKNNSTDPLRIDPWEIAIELETLIALGRHDDAIGKAIEYADCNDADAFEIASTLRQLVEVWQLNDKVPPGLQILPILRSALLQREGAILNLDSKEIREGLSTFEAAKQHLEKRLGPTGSKSLNWLKTGLKRCESIARVERPTGEGHGTGWLVKASDFFPNMQGVLVLTNAHVISSTSYPESLSPNKARINFQVLGKVYEVDKVVKSFPVEEFDATFVSLKGDPPDSEPLPIEIDQVTMTQPPPRIYIIGHPGGRGMEFSLQDNYLLGYNEKLIHYRTPTEGGSSGSPVFEQNDWMVIGLHHAGSEKMNRLDGNGTYEANEGILIQAIQDATRKI